MRTRRLDIEVEGAVQRSLHRPQTVRGPDESELMQLQRAAGNQAVGQLIRHESLAQLGFATRGFLQRQVAAPPKMDPKQYATFAAWLQALPANAVDENAVDVTDDVKAELPDLAGLVTDLKADCADVTILLRHYYLQAHGQTGTLKSINVKDKMNPIRYTIGSGVSKADLKNTLINIGTTNFQDNKNRYAFVNYYGGASPTKNLKKLIAAGLAPGDLLVWKRLSGIVGNFEGHVQTIQKITPAYLLPPGVPGPQVPGQIEVLQGTMEAGVAKAEVQSKVLTFDFLTGKMDGDGPISVQPENEEEFYGAAKW